MQPIYIYYGKVFFKDMHILSLAFLSMYYQTPYWECGSCCFLLYVEAQSLKNYVSILFSRNSPSKHMLNSLISILHSSISLS